MFEAQAMWGWQIALYLFLGGLAAGTFVVSAVVYFKFLKHTGKKPLALCIATWLSTACLGAGLLLLLTDLTQPLRGLLLWQSFSNPSSWMMRGAWIVFVAVIVFGVTALLLTVQVVRKNPAMQQGEAAPDDADASAQREPRASKALSALFGIGAVLGVGVAAYTGILLMSAQGIPFWGSALLPCLFTVSAIGTGIALVEIILACTLRESTEETQALGSFLKACVVAFAVIEAAVLAAYLVTMSGDVATADSVAMLTSGELSGAFWGLVVLCALAVPIFAAVVGLLVKKKAASFIGLAGAACALVGGCALRFCILGAGGHIDQVVSAFTAFIS